MSQPPDVPSSPRRALALDALRGLAMLAMLLSGQLPFDSHALPAWMYHAQEPPPDFVWNGSLPGVSWVDLVFPFFLFSMGAAFPLALSRRMDGGRPSWRLLAFVGERGFLLAFFALFVRAIRPGELSRDPTTGTWLVALAGFFILFPILTRLPAGWPVWRRRAIRAGGWLAALLFFVLARYPDGSGFALTRSDIIIVVMANVAVFGSLAWMLTRRRLVLRLGLLGFLLALRLSNLPQPVTGWVHDLWQFSPAPWIYQLYYLQYLFIVLPGTIAGDLILRWIRDGQARDQASQEPPSASWRDATAAGLLLVLVVVVVAGLKARCPLVTNLAALALCGGVWGLLTRPVSGLQRLHTRLFAWAVYWLALGLLCEPYEGGIKKDHPTLSYYFVTSGLAICVYLALSILIEGFRRRRAVQWLIDNGQNPMIAYAGINNFITPALALTGGSALLAEAATTPWRGFVKGVVITALMALTVAGLTRRKIFWRT